MMSNLIYIILLMAFFVGCNNHHDDNLYSLLKNKYANLYVNDSTNKNKLIEQFKNLKITDDNFNAVSNELNKLGDGHVYLQKEGTPLFKYKTDLEFIPGTHFISKCQKSCSPSLLGKFKILEINNRPVFQFLEDSKYKVFASSSFGRVHRQFQLLQYSIDPIAYEMKVINLNGEIKKVKIVNVDSNSHLQCVSGKRLNRNSYYVKINTLWCDQNGRINNDKDIYNQFKKEWNDTISRIQASDEILLDLRENNGGGDFEVMLVLNTFIKQPVMIYKYQFLKSTIYSKIEWIKNFFSSDKIWGKKENEYTNMKYIPNKTLFSNKVKAITSAGCFSSCEGLVGNLKIHNRASVFGERTHGGAGDPKFFRIENSKFLINLPTSLVWFSNGEIIEGKGVEPNIQVKDIFKTENDEILNFVLNS